MRIHSRLAQLSNSVAVLYCLFHVLTPPCRADLLAGTAFESGVRRLDETTGAQLPGSVAPGSAGLDLTSGVTVGPDGNIYVSSRGSQEVLFYDGNTGLPLPSPHPGGDPGFFATLDTPLTPNSAPGPLRFGPDNHLYVSDFGGTQVRKFNGTTGLEMAAAATVVGPPAGLAFDSSGTLYVGDFGSAAVYRVQGGVATPFVTPGSGGLLTPSSLLFLPSGELLVVNMFGNQILKYDQNGQNPMQFAVIPPPPDPPPSNYPSDIVFDSNGDLVLAVLGATNPPDNRGQILRYDVSGAGPEVLLDMQPPFASIARIDPAIFAPGDYDRNGAIEPADYDKWRADFGQSVTNGQGADGNGDGLVDAADYVVWRRGAAAGAGASIQAPEPASVILVMCGAILCLTARVRKSPIRVGPH